MFHMLQHKQLTYFYMRKSRMTPLKHLLPYLLPLQLTLLLILILVPHFLFLLFLFLFMLVHLSIFLMGAGE